MYNNQKNQPKSRVNRRKQQKRKRFILSIISFVFMCYALVAITTYVKADTQNFGDNIELASDNNYKPVINKLYKSIKIQKGDNLWDIAKDYYEDGDYNSIDDYITEVKKINHLLDDNITTGKYITIPYYEITYSKSI